MRVLGLVTARGGSKGFPGKNLAPLAGRPLVAWAHRTLAQLRQRHPQLVVHLSTDSQAIADAWPVEDRPAMLRPAALAADDTSSLAVVEYELDQLGAGPEGPFDAVLLLQPTSPLVNLDDLEAAWQLWQSGDGATGKTASVIGVTALEHPLAWSLRVDATGVVHPATELNNDQRQSQAAAYRPVGFYLSDVQTLRRERRFIVPGHTKAVTVPPERGIDIDYPHDLNAAQNMLLHAAGSRALVLAGHRIAQGQPPFIIAEAGVNHNGKTSLALELVDAAAAGGAQAIKFQTFDPAALVTRHARQAAYQTANTGTTQSQFDMLQRLALPLEAWREIKTCCDERGLVFLSSPFDLASAQLLADLDIAAFKLGSGELTNHPLLARIASMGWPMILSTGMATLDEVQDARDVLAAHGNPPTAWLHCVSAYPAPPEATNLRAMDSLRMIVGDPVGLSDHALGWAVSLAAVARGACILEKHLTLSRTMPGPDHAASLEPAEFAQMVEQVRIVASAMGDGVKKPAACELDARAVARKSIVAARDLPAGHRLTPDDLAIKRPGDGLSPQSMSKIVGCTLRKAVAEDQPILADDVQGFDSA